MASAAPVQSTDRPADTSPEQENGPSTSTASQAQGYVQSTIQSEPERFTIAQAATLLGTSRDAIRQRIRRGTLRSEKADGKWYVYLAEEPTSEQASGTDGLNREASDHPSRVQSTHPTDELYRQLIDQLRGEVSFLREELRRKDQLLAGIAQRLPSLEPPQPAVERSHEAGGGTATSTDQPSQPAPPAAAAAPDSRRPWWKFWVQG